MKAEQLRKAILQMAIQGKLVPQDPNDEPASVLLEKIRAEKQKLIKEGKIKKDKVDSVIYKGDDNRHYEKVGNNAPVCIEDELPFDIPESWEWVKIGTISCSVGSKENQILLSEIIKQGTVPVVSQSQNLIDGYTNCLKKQISTLPLIMFGDHTKVVKYIDFKFVIGADGTKFHKAILVLPKYLYLLVSFYASQMPSRGYARHYSLLKKEYMPLPPLAEQSRIVAEIEKYEPLIAEYDKLEQQKTKLDSEIYDKLKKSILQYAIQGKLVPQDENDEPASELLKRIRAEKKTQLGKKYVDGYIYKGDDNRYYEHIDRKVKDEAIEVPFDLPDNWMWSRIQNISESYIGLTYKPSDIVRENGYIVLRSSNIQNGKLALTDIVRVDTSITDKLRVKKNDIIICARNGSKKLVGKSAIVDVDLPNLTFGAFMAICKTPLYLYVYVFLQSSLFFSQLAGVSGTTTINQLTQASFNSFLIPVPPLAEQKRIVDKINEIFAKL